jgi:hypothetical protein
MKKINYKIIINAILTVSLIFLFSKSVLYSEFDGTIINADLNATDAPE